MIKIDPEFKALIPPLSTEEREQLEANILQDGCRDPLVVWDGTLIDGHNRYEICARLDLPFDTKEYDFDTRDDAKVWIIQNQLGRRNLAPYSYCELAFKLEPLIKAQAKENCAAGGGDKKTQGSGLQNSANPIMPIDTRKELAKIAGVSHDTIAKAKVIHDKAPEEVKAKLRNDEISIHKAHSDIVREEKRAEVVAKLEDIEVREAKAAEGVYDVIVIDPPWPMQKIERDVAPNQVELDYPTMDEGELAALEVPCANDTHVWVWTTHKFLPMALRLLDAWDLKYVCCFTWHKPGGFQPFGLPQYNCEFALYARKGSPSFIDTKAFPVCFDAPRGKHSEKPEEFYDVVRRVTAGRRLDMFNRRSIEGFDTWGNEAEYANTTTEIDS